MSNIGTVTTVLNAKTAQFQAAMMGAETRLRSFGAAGQMVGGKMMALGGLLLGGVVAGGLGLMLKRTMDNMVEIGHLSETTGIATKEITSLGYAAEICGASQETMNRGLVFMNKNVGEAARGTGIASAALERLGLRAQDLIRLSPGEAFLQIAEKVSRLPNQMEKATATMQIFGRGGIALINTVQQGRAALEGMGQEAVRTGYAFDISTTRVMEAHESLIRLEAVIKGGLQAALIELAPKLEGFINYLIDAATAGEGLGPAVRKGVDEAITALGIIADIPTTAVRMFDTPGTILGEDKPVQALYDLWNNSTTPSEKMHMALDNLTTDLKLHAMCAKNSAAADAALKRSMADNTAFADLAQGVDVVNDKIREQIATVGMNANEIEIWKLKQKAAGISSVWVATLYNWELAKTIALQAELTKKEEAHKDQLKVEADRLQTAKTVEEMTADLNIDLDEATGKITELGAAFLKLKLPGITPEARAALWTLYATTDMHKKMAESSKQLWEENSTTLEKYSAQLQTLSELYANDYISQEIYLAAAKKAYNDFYGAKKPQDTGSFQSIRTDLIDVAGLNLSGKSDPLVNKMTENTLYARQSRDALMVIAGKPGTQ
jgi:hypothetical protein